MEKSKSSKILSIIALVVAIAGLTIGFAAFSNTLVISSSATVKPSESDFSVLFSTNNTTQATGTVPGTLTSGAGATAEDATISGTTITGLKANFTKPGQIITYSFYVHNAGLYDAYLKSVTYGTVAGTNSFIKCTIPEGSGATQTLVDAACENIKVHVDSLFPTSKTVSNITGVKLGKGQYQKVTVNIEYVNNAQAVDGDIDVAFGDITLGFSSTDA